MRQSSIGRAGLATSAAAAALIAGCGDQPTSPPDGAPRDAYPAFAVGAEAREQLGAALAFAREQSMRGLQQRDAAERVTVALEALAARVEANDRVGAERALAAARKAVEHYQKLSARDGGASAADLDALTLTLDHATALVEQRVSSPEASDQ